MIYARGLLCPMPVVMVQKEVKKSAPAALEVMVDNQCAVDNVSRFAGNQGYAVQVEAQGADLVSPFLSSPPAPFSRERSPYRTWACRVTPGGLHLLPASSGPQPHLAPFSLLSFGKTNQVARLEKISPAGCLLQASHEPHCSCGLAT